jgi:hypothetical protein
MRVQVKRRTIPAGPHWISCEVWRIPSHSAGLRCRTGETNTPSSAQRAKRHHDSLLRTAAVPGRHEVQGIVMTLVLLAVNAFVVWGHFGPYSFTG